ncbi:MAG: sensor histidine kinase, partial [Methanobacterium sp.]
RERFGEDCGKRCYEYLFGFNEPCENCETYKVLKTGKTHNWEWKGPDGRNYDIYDFPFKDTDGSPMIMEFGIDITERKMAGKQLKETINELEHSNQELQSFAYITSHDLQEPLRSIASYAQLLQRRYEGQLDSDADDFIDFMVAGATRMKEQIQGLLDYSRVGTQGEEFIDFNSVEALNQALSSLKSSIDECHAVVNYDNLPVIHADENQITRVFQNLIGNALKFRNKDVQPKISVKTLKEGDEYVFSVQDNGIGMEKQYSDHIFEVFKRLHPIGEYDGTGIGLAIVKRIMERHGGRIWVESEFGVGSTFYFTIPIVRPSDK